MSAPPNALLELFRAARQFADATYPGHRGIEVTIETADGRRTVLQVPPCACGGDDDADARARGSLNEMERNLLQALSEAAGPLAGEAAARAAGYEFTGRVQEALARLVRLKLARTNGKQGYSTA